MDDAGGTDQIGKREREGSRSRAEIRPLAALALSESASEQPDVVSVVHQPDVPTSLSRQPSVERATVNGPSASIAMVIVPPRRPCLTLRPARRSTPQKRPKRPWPTSGGATAGDSGRL